MSDTYILNDDGQPEPAYNLIDWARWLASHDTERTLGRDTVGEATVSTVFLGIDHAFGGPDPVLWETMIFGGPHDGYQERYTSKSDAMVGHAKAIVLAAQVLA